VRYNLHFTHLLAFLAFRQCLVPVPRQCLVPVRPTRDQAMTIGAQLKVLLTLFGACNFGSGVQKSINIVETLIDSRLYMKPGTLVLKPRMFFAGRSGDFFRNFQRLENSLNVSKKNCHMQVKR